MLAAASRPRGKVDHQVTRITSPRSRTDGPAPPDPIPPRNPRRAPPISGSPLASTEGQWRVLIAGFSRQRGRAWIAASWPGCCSPRSASISPMSPGRPVGPERAEGLRGLRGERRGYGYGARPSRPWASSGSVPSRLSGAVPLIPVAFCFPRVTLSGHAAVILACTYGQPEVGGWAPRP